MISLMLHFFEFLLHFKLNNLILKKFFIVLSCDKFSIEVPTELLLDFALRGTLFCQGVR